MVLNLCKPMGEIKTLPGIKTTKITNGQIICGKETGTCNTFEHPNQVTLQKFEDASFKNGTLKIKIPAK